MAIYVKPLRMLDAAGYQATENDGMPVLNTDDPDCLALTVGAGTATALPTTGGFLYWVVSTEASVVFLRAGTGTGDTAGATHFPVPAGQAVTFRVGAGVTHIHAGSGA